MKTIVLILAVLNLVGCSESPKQVAAHAELAKGWQVVSPASASEDPNDEYMKCSVTLHRVAAIVGQDAIRVEFDPQFVERDGQDANCTWFVFADQFGKSIGGCGLDVEAAAKHWLREYAEAKHDFEHPRQPTSEPKSGLTAKAGACGTTIIERKASAHAVTSALPDSEKPEKK